MIDIENTITYLLTPISNLYWTTLEKSMNEINLHSGQVFVLISLWKQDGQSQIELSKNLNLAPPTVNKMVKNLVENDFVISQKEQKDGRIMRVFLTEKALEFRSLIEEQWVKIEAQIFLNFTETEKLILFQLFDKLKINLIARVAAEQSGL
ncbi:MAG: MarR family winged helix-turn-helix transcriptional regulator [Pyrinomonadaceae bacterium]